MCGNPVAGGHRWGDAQEIRTKAGAVHLEPPLPFRLATLGPSPPPSRRGQAGGWDVSAGGPIQICPEPALISFVVPAITQPAIILAEIPVSAAGGIATVAVGIADEVQITCTGLSGITVSDRRRTLAIGIAITTVARRIAMNVDTPMRIAARGGASRRRRTCRSKYGKTDQQKQIEMKSARLGHRHIPGIRAGILLKEGDLAGQGYRIWAGKLMA
jgi:hypothetical protein